MIKIEERPEWRQWVTPSLLREAPVHRWLSFPHSYTGELVDALIKEWRLARGARVLDPFAGAGTTAVEAQLLGMRAIAFDLSPLAVLTTRVKTAAGEAGEIEDAWKRVKKSIARFPAVPIPHYPELVERALPGKLLPTFHMVKAAIERNCSDKRQRDFLLLALLAVLPKFSKLVATGGWLSIRRGGRRAAYLTREFAEQVALMLEDARHRDSVSLPRVRVDFTDARHLPLPNESIDAVITSPPYVNRHDYTRVFGVELLFGFLNAEEIKRLRYQSFCSHPESHPALPLNGAYRPPHVLSRLLAQLKHQNGDSRVPAMLEGYFKDIYFMLAEIARVLRPGAYAGIVIGNVQYGGLAFPVDKITAKIGRTVGLDVERLIVARYRGNSAQQMAVHGRRPARESIVVLRKPSSGPSSNPDVDRSRSTDYRKARCANVR
jgi:hypothetical protein